MTDLEKLQTRICESIPTSLNPHSIVMSNQKYEKPIYYKKICDVCGYWWIVQDDPEVQCPQCLKKDLIIRTAKCLTRLKKQ